LKSALQEVTMNSVSTFAAISWTRRSSPGAGRLNRLVRSRMRITPRVVRSIISQSPTVGRSSAVPAAGIRDGIDSSPSAPATVTRPRWTDRTRTGRPSRASPLVTCRAKTGFQPRSARTRVAASLIASGPYAPSAGSASGACTPAPRFSALACAFFAASAALFFSRSRRSKS